MRGRDVGRDLTQGSIAPTLLAFIGPLFLSNVLQTVYNVVDMAVVGHYVGNSGLSAVSVCGDIIHVLTFTAMGFANAGQVLISHSVGAEDQERVRRTIGNLFALLLYIGVIVSTLTLVFRDAILSFGNTPPEAFPQARIYLTVYAAGLLFSYGYNAVSAILRGMGDSLHPFLFVAIASIMNVVLDILMVAVLDMGVFGAAFATVLSNAASFFVSAAFFIRNRHRFGAGFRFGDIRFERESLLSLVRLGIPMAMQSGSIQFSKLVVIRWVNAYGLTISAITGIGGKFNSIGITFFGAVGTSSAAMIGQCIGAKKYDRVGKTLLVSWGLSFSIMSVLAAAVLFFPQTVFGLFTSGRDILALTGQYAPVVAIMFLCAALRAPMNGLINGSGNSKMNFLLAILDGVVGHIGFSAFFGFALGIGIKGLWYGNSFAGIIPFIVGIIYYFSGEWRKERPRRG